MFDTNHDAIIPTADYMAYYRGLSDIPYAQEISEILGAEKITRDILGTAFDEVLFTAVTAEVRYKKINFFIEHSPFINILELAAGRSPRALQVTANPAITYVATDIASSLETYVVVMRQIMQRHALVRPNLITSPVDVFNDMQLQRAISLLPPGPVLFIVEGLLSYYPHKQKKQILRKVLRHLKERGGAFVAADFSYNAHGAINTQANSALLQITGRSIIDNSFASFDEAHAFLVDVGFSVKRLSVPMSFASLLHRDLLDNVSARRITELPVWVLEAHA